jgi:hypothetical protein
VTTTSPEFVSQWCEMLDEVRAFLRKLVLLVTGTPCSIATCPTTTGSA